MPQILGLKPVPDTGWVSGSLMQGYLLLVVLVILTNVKICSSGMFSVDFTHWTKEILDSNWQNIMF